MLKAVFALVASLVVKAWPLSDALTAELEAQEPAVARGAIGPAGTDFSPARVPWKEDFNDYAVGSQLVGQGGWQYIFNEPNVGAHVTIYNAMEIPANSDIVHEFIGTNIKKGSYVFSGEVFVPNDFVGASELLFLSVYIPIRNAQSEISNLVVFADSLFGTENAVVSLIGDTVEERLFMVRNKWIKFSLLIDLDKDEQTFIYNGQLLFKKSWTEGFSTGGALNIAAVNFGGLSSFTSSIYYDNLSLVKNEGHSNPPDHRAPYVRHP